MTVGSVDQAGGGVMRGSIALDPLTLSKTCLF